MTSHPVKVTALQGHVKEELYAKGTKSERNALFFETSDSHYILRRKTGPVYDDIELKKYIGHLIECEGFLVDNTLLAEQITMID